MSELQESTATATEALDRALASLADTQMHNAERVAQARARAQAEFADVNPVAFAKLLADMPVSAPHRTAGR
ncbi:MAG: hypothetical protein ACREPV_08455 [Lysobacter sp.]